MVIMPIVQIMMVLLNALVALDSMATVSTVSTVMNVKTVHAMPMPHAATLQAVLNAHAELDTKVIIIYFRSYFY